MSRTRRIQWEIRGQVLVREISETTPIYSLEQLQKHYLHQLCVIEAPCHDPSHFLLQNPFVKGNMGYFTGREITLIDNDPNVNFIRHNSRLSDVKPL